MRTAPYAAPGSLDRLLRGLRSHIRTRRLPRPDRLMIATGSRTAGVEFTTGTGRERLARLVVWSMTLHQVAHATVLILPNSQLLVQVTGRGPVGLTITLHTTCALTELGSRVRQAQHAWVGPHRLVVNTPDTVSIDELATVLTTTRTTVAAPPVLGLTA